MIRNAVFSLLFGFASAAMAMDSTNALAEHTSEPSAQAESGTKEKPVAEMSIWDFPAYIGECSERDRIEKHYGCNFPLNTIFMRVTWEGNDKNLPHLIPYDYICGKKEGESFGLIVKGEKHIVCCKQKSGRNWRKNDSFDFVVAAMIKGFSNRACWYAAGSGSLVLANIVNRSTKTKHGEKASPFVQIEKEAPVLSEK